MATTSDVTAPSPTFANNCVIGIAADHFVLEFGYATPSEGKPIHAPVARIAVPLSVGFDIALSLFKSAFVVGPKLTAVFAKFQEEVNRLNALSTAAQSGTGASGATGK